MSEAPTKGARWAMWLPLGLFAGFAALLVVGLMWPADKTVKSRFVGQPLPEFNLAAASDDRPGLSRADFVGGKPRLLNVFASWCVPCAAEAPQLEALRQAGVEIHGVALRDHKPELAAFLARNGNPFSRIGADNLSVVQVGIGSAGVPETFVIDSKGVIRHQHIGVIMADDVPKLLAKLREAEQ
ncbi:redoxin family protein [Novosphingobium sp. TH158]|uniref:redoxin family protein n=1 Tax=Novosphingobium sp. TH158 TaxID=2067455 RepID=UPI000C7DC6CE|nr:redoxin family protein [Novosphingobium sp. TH158]PLK25698.1 DsbE family thiol:disulfide interchange protein [Novosphingobium sp. TH158]